MDDCDGLPDDVLDAEDRELVASLNGSGAAMRQFLEDMGEFQSQITTISEKLEKRLIAERSERRRLERSYNELSELHSELKQQNVELTRERDEAVQKLRVRRKSAAPEEKQFKAEARELLRRFHEEHDAWVRAKAGLLEKLRGSEESCARLVDEGDKLRQELAIVREERDQLRHEVGGLREECERLNRIQLDLAEEKRRGDELGKGLVRAWSRLKKVDSQLKIAKRQEPICRSRSA